MLNPERSLIFRTVRFTVLALSLLVGAVLLAWGFGAIWLVALFLVVEIVRKRRAARQYALLWLLTVSGERAMPLGPAVRAFAREQNSWFSFGRRVGMLADLLESGVSLPEALEQIGGLLPARAASMIRVGSESGALAPALRRAATLHYLHEPLWMSLIGKIAYLLLVFSFGMMILVFIMLKIVPAYQKIFADFGDALPPLTQALIASAQWYVSYWYLMPLPILFGLLGVYALFRYWGWVQWDLPGLRRFARRLDAAQVLDALALSTGRQRPIGEGIAALAETYPKSDIRHRLRQTLDDLRAGGDWCDSLLARGLLTATDRAVLQAAQRAGNLPWAMREMAQSGRRRLGLRVWTILQVAFPLIILTAGLIVMFVVAALFLPLVALIHHMAAIT